VTAYFSHGGTTRHALVGGAARALLVRGRSCVAGRRGARSEVRGPRSEVRASRNTLAWTTLRDGSNEHPEEGLLAMNKATAQSCDLVYIVLAHNQPDLFGRLVRRLHRPNVGFIVHVDSKTDRTPFDAAVADLANVRFVESRVSVRWAAFSQVESTLRAMRLALDTWHLTPSHYVILSGADYPVKHNSKIVAALNAHPGRQFIRRFDIVASQDKRQIRRIRGRHFRQAADRNTLARKPLFALEFLLRAFPRRLPTGIRFMSGSNWIALTPSCVEWCISYTDANPRFRRLFVGMFAPDEIYFHTLIENSPFVMSSDAVEPYYDVTAIGGPWRYGNLHYLHPIRNIEDPTTVTPLFDEAQPLLFARKFGLPGSATVLDLIDEKIDGMEQERQARTSRSG
jgi:hypothetical protein